MKRRYKILGGIAGVIAVGVVVFGAVLAHENPCPTASEEVSGDASMKAWTARCYGGPEVLQLESVAKPAPADDEVLVRVRAASVNPLDWHSLRGEPRIMRMSAGIGTPKDPYNGVDFAGVVESAGKGVTKFKPGDEVFGIRGGAFGEFVQVREDRNVVLKPANVSFQEAAAMPVAAVTALQALREQGQVKSGQKVLINGASGGVGTYAVQLAKNFGAEVTAVCSGRNVAMVQSLGADHVVDYTKEDVTAGATKFDLIVDIVGTHSMSDYRRILTADGNFVVVGALSDGKWLGPLGFVIRAKVYDLFASPHVHFFISHANPEDLKLLADLMQEGKLKSVIDKTYPLSEVPEAIRYLETGRARGKVVIDVQ
jgi:NADPH:quinone reductase-like Zn-dependent oxidoreductase